MLEKVRCWRSDRWLWRMELILNEADEKGGGGVERGGLSVCAGGVCAVAFGRWMMSLLQVPQRRAGQVLRLRLGSPIISLAAIKCSSFILAMLYSAHRVRESTRQGAAAPHNPPWGPALIKRRCVSLPFFILKRRPYLPIMEEASGSRWTGPSLCFFQNRFNL